jgi:catechol 2,3-dioxygenase-like lactoylglutathione lyase family enzyme
MQLLDHVSISVGDIDRAKRCYKAILSTLGAVVAYEGDDAIGFDERNRPNDDRHTCLSIYQSTQAVSGVPQAYISPLLRQRHLYWV